METSSIENKGKYYIWVFSETESEDMTSFSNPVFTTATKNALEAMTDYLYKTANDYSKLIADPEHSINSVTEEVNKNSIGLADNVSFYKGETIVSPTKAVAVLLANYIATENVVCHCCDYPGSPIAERFMKSAELSKILAFIYKYLL